MFYDVVMIYYFCNRINLSMKFKNKSVRVSDKTFDSKKEARRYEELLLMERAGLISDLRCQVRFELVRGVKFASEKRKKPSICYWADFTYMRDGDYVVEDVKSDITRKEGVYRIKKHLMMYIHGIEIREV